MRSTFDNSILSDFKKCMRLGYYRHVRGWQPAGMHTALVFGRAWHAAMDVVWRAACTPDGHLQDDPFKAFLAEWYACGATYPIPQAAAKFWGARTPDVAKLMLEAYVKQRGKLLRTLTLVECEGRFRVPLHGGVNYVGRRDKVVRTEAGDLILVEHKTTALGSKNGFRDDWLESWHNKAQLDGYRFSYPGLQAVWVDAALVHPAVRRFEFIPVRQDHNRAQAWLWETRYWVDQVNEHWARLGQDEEGLGRGKTGHFFLPAFPKNDEACIQYNRLCPYFHTCKNVANPEAMRDPPRGMKVEFWEPEAE